nr:hypothetical protein [Victivallis lenta]
MGKHLPRLHRFDQDGKLHVPVRFHMIGDINFSALKAQRSNLPAVAVNPGLRRNAFKSKINIFTVPIAGNPDLPFEPSEPDFSEIVDSRIILCPVNRIMRKINGSRGGSRRIAGGPLRLIRPVVPVEPRTRDFNISPVFFDGRSHPQRRFHRGFNDLDIVKPDASFDSRFRTAVAQGEHLQRFHVARQPEIAFDGLPSVSSGESGKPHIVIIHVLGVLYFEIQGTRFQFLQNIHLKGHISLCRQIGDHKRKLIEIRIRFDCEIETVRGLRGAFAPGIKGYVESVAGWKFPDFPNLTGRFSNSSVK